MTFISRRGALLGMGALVASAALPDVIPAGTKAFAAGCRPPAAPGSRRLLGFANRCGRGSLLIVRRKGTFEVPLRGGDSMHLFREACADLNAGGATTEMDPALLDHFAWLVDHFGCGKLELVSGYRTRGHQQRMYRAGQTTATGNGSYHPQGMAGDIRLPGVRNSAIFEAVKRAGWGGTKAYPTFTHVDVRGRFMTW